MPEITLDGMEIENREQLHTLLAERFALPEWYGKNLDALFDCLTDLREETVLSILHQDVLQENLGDYAARFLRVLQDAQNVNPQFCVRLSAFEAERK